jgi:hypothetical protein
MQVIACSKIKENSIMSFIFTAGVDPKNPIEPSDVPPLEWCSVGSDEHSSDFIGPPSQLFLRCLGWNYREYQRVRGNHHETNVETCLW